MKTNERGGTVDDYGLRGEPACSDCVADTAGRSSTVVVAVVVHRKAGKTGEKTERLLNPYTKENWTRIRAVRCDRIFIPGEMKQ